MHIIFIYGIRAFEHDFLFKEELEELFLKFGEKSEVHICQSRPESTSNHSLFKLQ